MERASPAESTKFQTRELLGMLGVSTGPEDPSLSLSEQEDKLAKDTQNQLRGAREYLECLNSLDKAIDEEFDRKRE